MDPMMMSMMGGAKEAQQQMGSAPPNAYQPQGVPNSRTILCGQLKLIVDQLNKSASLLNQQGAGSTAIANQLMKASYDVNRVCEQLEKEAQDAGQPY